MSATATKPVKAPPASACRDTPGVVCPNCGHPQEDVPDIGDGLLGTARCESCRQHFGWTASVRVSFTTRKTKNAGE